MRKYAKLYAAILRVSVVVNSVFERLRGRRQNCYPKTESSRATVRNVIPILRAQMTVTQIIQPME